MKANLITDVADTAFWIAYHRAEESAKPDALFKDPLAERLAGERGRAIAKSIPWNFYISWMVPLRTIMIDDFIREALAAGVDTVLNLGAGLDTRPYRLQLPPALRWIEADQAGVIAYKSEILKHETPTCHLEREVVDLAHPDTRQAFLAQALAGSQHTLVLTEGVVPYLPNPDVAALAKDLLAQPSVRGWILEYTSPIMAKLRDRQPKRTRLMQNAPFLFQPEDWEGFFKDAGWAVEDLRYFFEEAGKRGRGLPGSWSRQLFQRLMGIFASKEKREGFRKSAGYALMRRGH